jgi:hypothetical protein
VQDGEGFTVVRQGLVAGEAEVAAEVLRAAGIDARVLESEAADSLDEAIVSDRRDVIVPADQAEAAMAMMETSTEPAPPAYRLSPREAVMPLVAIGAILFALALIIALAVLLGGHGPGAITGAGWSGLIVAVIVGLAMVLWPLLATRSRGDAKTAARPRSRIVS